MAKGSYLIIMTRFKMTLFNESYSDCEEISCVSQMGCKLLDMLREGNL